MEYMRKIEQELSKEEKWDCKDHEIKSLRRENKRK